MSEKLQGVRERVRAHSARAHATTKYVANDFVEFLREYKIASLAIAFILGGAANQLVKSLVDNVIMPMIVPALPSGGWEQAVFSFGEVSIRWGKFTSDFIYFLIIAIFIYFFAKILIRGEKKQNAI